MLNPNRILLKGSCGTCEFGLNGDSSLQKDATGLYAQRHLLARVLVTALSGVKRSHIRGKLSAG